MSSYLLDKPQALQMHLAAALQLLLPFPLLLHLKSWSREVSVTGMHMRTFPDSFPLLLLFLELVLQALNRQGC